MDDQESRFWITTPEDGYTLNLWVAVVDEERGGIIAYFGREEDAEAYIAWRESEGD